MFVSMSHENVHISRTSMCIVVKFGHHIQIRLKLRCEKNRGFTEIIYDLIASVTLLLDIPT